MKLEKKFIIVDSKSAELFELVVIKPEELKSGYTTSDIISEANRLGYIVLTKTEAYSLRNVLNKSVAHDIVDVWILVAIYKNEEDTFPKFGATIVSGVLHENEGSSIPDYGKNPNHQWEPGIAFVFIAPFKGVHAVETEGASSLPYGC